MELIPLSTEHPLCAGSVLCVEYMHSKTLGPARNQLTHVNRELCCSDTVSFWIIYLFYGTV